MKINVEDILLIMMCCCYGLAVIGLIVLFVLLLTIIALLAFKYMGYWALLFAPTLVASYRIGGALLVAVSCKIGERLLK